MTNLSELIASVPNLLSFPILGYMYLDKISKCTSSIYSTIAFEVIASVIILKCEEYLYVHLITTLDFNQIIALNFVFTGILYILEYIEFN